jgi:hypothetical protein
MMFGGKSIDSRGRRREEEHDGCDNVRINNFKVSKEHI